MFVDREEEASLLNDAITGDAPALVRLWGRRRLGKTSLIREKLPGVVYLYVDESATAVQLPRLAGDIKTQTGRQVASTSWPEFFRDLAGLDAPVAFDEFQRLLDSDPAAVAALQDAWDNHLRPRGARIILCGSSIGMMQRLVRGKHAPLLGRFTAQMQLRPLPFEHARLLKPEVRPDDFLAWYAVFGGTPFYLEQGRGASLVEAIDHAFLSPTAPLLDEPENLLASELRRPATYSAILQAVGAGKRRLGDIASALNRRSTDLTPYIRVLVEDVGILRKDDPVMGPRQTARYAFGDPFFRFYYTIIHPALSSIHDGLAEPTRRRIRATMPVFVGPVWEEVVRDALRRRAGTRWRGLDLSVDTIGAWWTRQGDHEIDVVAASDDQLILGSCKWTSQPMGMDDLAQIERAAEAFPGGPRTRSYLLASRAGFTDALNDATTKRDDVNLFTWRDMVA
jgi:AAA+ ATPase superfamily predicted ATPase